MAYQCWQSLLGANSWGYIHNNLWIIIIINDIYLANSTYARRVFREVLHLIELEFGDVDFWGEGKTREPREKPLGTTLTHVWPWVRNPTQATLVGGKCNHHFAIPAPNDDHYASLYPLRLLHGTVLDGHPFSYQSHPIRLNLRKQMWAGLSTFGGSCTVTPSVHVLNQQDNYTACE